jgi:hypothetical protein
MDVDYASGVVAGHVRRYPPLGFPITKNWKEIDRAIAEERPAFALYPHEYPLFVRFRDINDATSVEKVDAADMSALGPGVNLRRITIRVTEDKVTGGIEKRFPWWDAHKNRHFDGTSTVSEDMTDKNLSAHLSSGSFSTEFNR